MRVSSFILLVVPFALAACGEAGPPAGPEVVVKSVEDWIAELEEPDPRRRIAAARALAARGAEAAPAVPKLVALLDERVLITGYDPETPSRQGDAPDAENAEKRAVVTQVPNPPGVRAAAADALAAIGAPARLALLGLLGPGARVSTAKLVGAARALGGMGPDAAEALPLLRKALEAATDPGAKESLAAAIEAIGG
jgi:hypothetical protein